jgi:hypothetical protein
MRHSRFVMTLAVVLGLVPAVGLAADPPKPPTWAGTAGAGLILLTGNTSSVTANAAAGAQRDSSDWILAAKATGVYGRTRPVDRALPAQTVALAATGLLRADRRLGPHFTVFADAGLDTDHVASLEYRAYGDAGLGYVWLDVKREGGRELFLRTDLGGRYAYDARWQYFATASAPAGDLPDVELVAPRAGATFRFGFSKDVSLAEDAEVLANVSGNERWLAKSVTKLVSRLTRSVSFGASYSVTYDSAPAPGKVRTDTALGVSLEVAF